MTYQPEKEHDNGIEIKIDPQSNPVTVAVFDEDEKVTEDIAALQIDEVAWYAKGYSEAKEKYED